MTDWEKIEREDRERSGVTLPLGLFIFGLPFLGLLLNLLDASTPFKIVTGVLVTVAFTIGFWMRHRKRRRSEQ